MDELGGEWGGGGGKLHFPIYLDWYSILLHYLSYSSTLTVGFIAYSSLDRI